MQVAGSGQREQKQETLGNRWGPLIEQTWEGRHNPEVDASPEHVNETLEFIRLAREQNQNLEASSTD